MRIAPVVKLTADERRTLLNWVKKPATPPKLQVRAQIILAAAAGRLNIAIAEEIGIGPKTVSLWRSRFVVSRIAGIENEAPRPGRTPSIPARIIDLILRKTRCEKPKGATQWSTRKMAKAVGVSKATVQRVWSTHGLKPHLNQCVESEVPS